MNDKSNLSGWVRDTLYLYANKQPNETVLRYCLKDNTQEFNYKDIICLSSYIARHISYRENAKAIILIPGNTQFILGFLACIIRGVTAVPVNLPASHRLGRVADTINYIFADCQPEYIITLKSSINEIEKRQWHIGRQIIVLDDILTENDILEIPSANEYKELMCPNDGPVFLQYSSGSTGKPKAVCNFDANMQAQHEILLELHRDCQPRIITANWIPFYHDMGMFCGLLTPLLSGGCCNFISPSHFTADPARWLKLITDYSANSTAAPDFAWQLCIDSITQEQATEFDLSSLKMVLNAAEPIRAETMPRFARHFSVSGFNPLSFVPAYGMAEATLVISRKPAGMPFISQCFDADRLASGYAVPAENGRELVSSGQVVSGWKLRIVDPETGEILPEGRVGEIWVDGDSKAPGYWQKPELSQQTFMACLNQSIDKSHYLRTGDLAFIWQGELYICGRHKDLIIVAGENYMPNDIEASIEMGCEDVKIGGACACQQVESGELFVFAEVYRHLEGTKLQVIAQQIAARVASDFQLSLANVVLLPHGALKKTSSGKIRRKQMLADFENNQLKVLFALPCDIDKKEASSLPGWLYQLLCSLLHLDNPDPACGFAELGLTSLLAARYCQQINKIWRCNLAPADLFAYPTITQLAKYIDKLSDEKITVSATKSESTGNKQIAIIAISCRLPGQTSNKWQQYGQWLAKSELAVRPSNSALRQFALPIGALEGIDQFDARFFNISGREAVLLDPQQRLLLELSWHLFEQAGWLPEQLKQSDTGFFIGQSGSEFGQQLLKLNNPEYAKSYLATGINTSASSGRLAKFYGTTGPALTIDTACSSSLVALDTAIRSLQQGQCHAAVAGGVNILLSPQIEQTLINAGMLSPKGRCATLSEDADGYVRGEGAALLLLKPYQQALDDGDPVLAVIESSCVAQDGESSSLTAPNPQAQSAMLKRLLEQADIAPDDIDLLEMHGTGTALGDPIELQAIDSVYGKRHQPLPLAACKAQIGHLEAAAGVASVVRAVAQIQQQQRFGHPTLASFSAKLSALMPRYRYSKQTESHQIERVAISSFSFTGTMAGLVLSKANLSDHTILVPFVENGLLPLSACSASALQQMANQLADLLENHQEQAGELLNGWLKKRHHHFGWRGLISYQNLATLIAHLRHVEPIQVDRIKMLEKGSDPCDWLQGQSYNWVKYAGNMPVSRFALAQLPLYPFNRESYWPEELRLVEQETQEQSESGSGHTGFDFVINWVADVLGTEPNALAMDDNLLNLGIDSLQMLDLVDECKKQHIILSLSSLFEQPTLAAWQQCWFSAAQPENVSKESEQPVIKWNGEPFELTSVQQAYWTGRQKEQTLGGIACQVYLELDCPLLKNSDIEWAVNQVHQRHDMLRMRITGDGKGEITAYQPVSIESYDWQQFSPSLLEEKRFSLRKGLETKVADLTIESGFGVVVSHTVNSSRLHINIDMVMADAMSLQILLRELSQLILMPGVLLPQLNYSFPQYLCEQAADNQLIDSRQYWQKRLVEQLPFAPQLPLAVKPEHIDKPDFHHRQWSLEQQSWLSLKELARSNGITPSMLLANCFAETLRGWAESPDFTLNLTIFNRRGEHPQLPDLVADFTTLLLLACHTQAGNSILENSRALNRQFMSDLDHVDYSAIQVMRDWSQMCGHQVLMPVVFTSNLGRDLLSGNELGDLNYLVSQTPQVWIDCQVMEHQGELLVSWDCVDGLFPQGMIDQMFSFMTHLISAITDNPQLLLKPVSHYVTPEIIEQRTEPKDRDGMLFTPRLLHRRFYEIAALWADSPAVITPHQRLSYGELEQGVLELAYRLKEQKVKAGDNLALLLPKGTEQVVAVLACLSVGAVYVPLDVAQQSARLQTIISQADISLIITNNEYQEPVSGWFDAVLNIEQTGDSRLPLSQVVYGEPELSAYIIFTSGSTGTPKGVVVSHQAAANTIDDINRRYGQREKTRVYALSALNFDLSVYDIFGPLASGGSLVMPEVGHEREAKQWLEQLHQEQVTVWNSVPALFDMLLVAAESDPRGLPDSLQQVLLSGDWVGLDLLPRLREVGSQAQLTAMGGATEAAIWSNAIDVDVIPSEWRSIPYGYPLSNQHYRVMDSQQRDCPDWVAGELWIGGKGVALGYYGDREKTDTQFVLHQGQRYYRTGDYGRFWPGGCLEFLGRKDSQIKLNGYRIELGEIETVALRHPAISKAVALCLSEPQKHLRLFVEGQVITGDFSTLADDILPEMPSFVQVENSQDDEQHIALSLLQKILIDSLQLTFSQPQSAEILYQQAGVIPRYQPLFIQWLKWLTHQGWLSERETGWQLNQGRQPDNKPVLASRMDGIYQALNGCCDWIAQVIQGKQNPLMLIDDPVLSPEVLVVGSPETEVVITLIADQIRRLSTILQRPVKVAELNGRSGLFAGKLLGLLSDFEIEYCLVEQAGSLRELAKYRLSGYPHQSQVCTVREAADYSADLVISNNALHRYADIRQGISDLQVLASSGSGVLVFESQYLSPLAQLTVLLLQDENGFTDLRQGQQDPLLDKKRWQQQLLQGDLPVQSVTVMGENSMLLMCKNCSGNVMVNRHELTQHLTNYLPAYMLPQYLHVLDKLPLSANGKIDRKALEQLAVDGAEQEIPQSAQGVELSGKAEYLVAKIWQQVLGAEPMADSNFFLLGGDSLHATRIVVALESEGAVDVTLAQVFSSPVLRDFARLMTFAELPKTKVMQLQHQESERYQPFPPTDVQRAYLMGRQAGFRLGGVATHYYNEYEGQPFDAMRLEQALFALIARHDALRIVFDEQGMQRVLPQQPKPALDVVHCSDQQWSEETRKLRESLSHRVLDPTQWPLFHVTLIQSDNGRNRLYIGLDNLILDGLSMRIFFTELEQLYQQPEGVLPSVGIGFRDYLTTVISDEEKSRKSANYWQERLAELPEAPKLPLICDPQSLGTPRFKRWQSVLPRQQWQTLTEKARHYQVTPSCLLLTCYAQVLAKWSESASLSINVTLFDRQPLHPDINHILGDFTSLLLLECHHLADENWLNRAQRLQQQLWQDLAHTDVSAVWVIRELNKQRQVTDLAMPVVFTSALGAEVMPYQESAQPFPPAIWGISQTPQVWIDHQVYEQDGELRFNWDVVDGLFPQGMVDTMFSAYCDLLTQLSVTPDWHTQVNVALPIQQQQCRQRVNDTHQELSFAPMHQRVGQAMTQFADRTAIIDGEQQVSYQQLEQHVQRLAQILVEQGVCAGDCVGVALPRGYQQVVAVLAVQWLGAAYVPLSVEWPVLRREQIAQQAGLICVVADSHLQWTGSIALIDINQSPLTTTVIQPWNSQAQDLAYIIFTSGSTGVPKGVAISHEAAINTIEAINRQHCVGKQDKVLALSALHFDLSVWDIFGVLSAGGTLVTVPETYSKDAAHWLTLIKQHQITLWNSVPALLEMALLLSENGEQTDALTSLRLVMLSGDWINLALPERLKRWIPQVQLVSMGGATEAAIWSNYWLVDELDPEWNSIPYGLPLPNQRFRVVNELNEDCPDWVAGELWIGGHGVALGYFGDDERTANQFISWQGERWYRTGDMGRYHPTGVLEFLGRRDQQVKISGYRIELGEIVQALKNCDGIEDALVFVNQRGKRPSLSACVLVSQEPDWSLLRQQLSAQLPEYAVPAEFGWLSCWPLTDNGKLDRKMIEQQPRNVVSQAMDTLPESPLEKQLADVLLPLLNLTQLSVHDNFFALGGDSFIATRFTSELRQRHNIDLPLWQVFNLQTIARMAQQLQSAPAEEAEMIFEEGSL
ncbi:non-ribosomal peptide synthetase [Photorhabdus temperata]|uniref:Peptide synthetase n=1 Tax=Photorhabdus temperata J3 TaxID=1389415 RepID=U7R609_PHOTE|nr:non-ribosomal peptide synthetase [Photorhabdus temperata]ERT15075.1 hypothetical protein O185_00110 [Photorhabdus temperata J3]